jgi:hypothetical protein
MQQDDLAVPFLERPPKLDGSYAGDIGFDPVGFSNYFDLRWLREAELKHGRVCMLGVVGFLVQEFVTLPMFQNGRTPIDDFFVVPATGLWQIFFTIGFVEAFSNGFKLTPGESDGGVFIFAAVYTSGEHIRLRSCLDLFLSMLEHL